MPNQDKTSGMKSAYELALEQLERQGIDPPREDGVSEEAREKIAEVRRKAEARLAQLEILLQKRLRETPDPAEREKAERDSASERRRVEEKRDAEIARLRNGA